MRWRRSSGTSGRGGSSVVGPTGGCSGHVSWVTSSALSRWARLQARWCSATRPRCGCTNSVGRRLPPDRAAARSSSTATTSRPIATCSRASPRAGNAAAMGRDGRRAGTGAEQVAERVGDDTALVVFSHVAYRSGYQLRRALRRNGGVAHRVGDRCEWRRRHQFREGPVPRGRDSAVVGTENVGGSPLDGGPATLG